MDSPQSIDDPKVILPQMINLLGIGPMPKPKWRPKFWHRHLERKRREQTLMNFKPFRYKPSADVIRMQIAQELRDFAERIIGYSDIDPEKSAIVRDKNRVSGIKWLQYFKFEPPKPIKISKRQHRGLVRKAIREADKKLQDMNIVPEPVEVVES